MYKSSNVANVHHLHVQMLPNNSTWNLSQCKFKRRMVVIFCTPARYKPKTFSSKKGKLISGQLCCEYTPEVTKSTGN